MKTIQCETCNAVAVQLQSTSTVPNLQVRKWQHMDIEFEGLYVCAKMHAADLSAPWLASIHRCLLPVLRYTKSTCEATTQYATSSITAANALWNMVKKPDECFQNTGQHWLMVCDQYSSLYSRLIKVSQTSECTFNVQCLFGSRI